VVEDEKYHGLDEEQVSELIKRHLPQTA
jgi:hypothetical protein